jgi:hypothetical protein
MGRTVGPVYTGTSAADASELQADFTSAEQQTGQTPLVISAGQGYGSMSRQFQRWLTDTLDATGLAHAPSGFALAGTASGGPLTGPPPSSMHVVRNDDFTRGRLSGTNACARGGSSAEQESQLQLAAMSQLLARFAVGDAHDPLLVFIQSVGDVAPTTTQPYDQNGDIRAFQIAGQISALGGSWATFLDLFASAPTTGYSLIGQTFTNDGSGKIASHAEVATTAPTAPPARLIGRLLYDSLGRLLPLVASAASGQRAAVFNQPPPQSDLAKAINPSTLTPTRFPHAGNPAWEAALQYLARAANLSYNVDDAGQVYCYRPPGAQSDVRSNYCGGVPDGNNPATYWGRRVWGRIRNAPYVPNSSYSAQILGAAKAQLRKEFSLVDDANEVTNALSHAFIATQSNDTKSIVLTYFTDVEQAEQRAQLESSPTDIGWLANAFTFAATVVGFATDDLAQILFVTAASLTEVGDLSTDGAGQSQVTGLSGQFAGETPAEAADSVAAQIANQVQTDNQVRYALGDVIVSDWGRLQGAAADAQNVPDEEAVKNAVNGARFAGISYTWSDLLRSTATVSNINDSGIDVYNNDTYNPPYDLQFTQNYQCWLSGTGVFHDGESMEPVYQGAKAGSVYTDPHNHFPFQSWTPYVLTISGQNPSGNQSNPPPRPASQDYAGFLPDALINGFFAPQPAPGTALQPVVGNGPPGGQDRRAARAHARTARATVAARRQ